MFISQDPSLYLNLSVVLVFYSSERQFCLILKAQQEKNFNNNRFLLYDNIMDR